MRISDWSSDVCSSDLIARNATFERPNDYYETLADRYRAMNAADLDAAARRYIRPNDLIWVIVGDAAKVGPQLQPLGLPVEVMKAERSEEHTSELQSLMRISYAVFCLKKKTKKTH